jgi:hypothetical protein
MLGIIQNTLVIFLKRLFGTQDPTMPLSSVPMSSEPQISTAHSYIDEPEEPPRQYNLRERKAINYAEDSD